MRIILCLLLTALSATAQDVLAPAENIRTDGIPPVPAELAAKIDRYGNFRSAGFAQWHPERLEMLITTRFGDTAQVHRVTQPMGMREQLSFFKEPIMGVGEYVDGESFTIRMDTGGNEFFQLYRFDPATGERTLLTDGKSRNTGGLRSEKTGQIVYQRVDADAEGAFTEFFITDPLKPESARKVATMRGGGWGATDWSPDGKQLLLNEYISISNSRIWLLDVETGNSKSFSPATTRQRFPTEAASSSRRAVGSIPPPMRIRNSCNSAPTVSTICPPKPLPKKCLGTSRISIWRRMARRWPTSPMSQDRVRCRSSRSAKRTW